MIYKIINSGSDGNSVIIEKTVMVDCGVSFKKLKEDYKDLKLVVLTHRHSDHFNKKTIKKLAQERPTLRFGACEWLIEDLVNLEVNPKNIDVYELNKTYDYGKMELEAFELFHDVPNCGYKIDIENKKVVYATDTNTLEHIEAKDFDLYLIESNYCPYEIEERIERKRKNGEYVYEQRAKENHMDLEKTNKWLLENMGDESIFEYLHQHKEKEGNNV